MNCHDTYLSCIVPVYNSGKTIQCFVNILVNELNTMGFSYEIILVDDNSDDDSRVQINALCDQFENIVKKIFLKKNKGQHFATLTGIFHSKGQYVVTIDDDRQFHPEDIPQLLKNNNANEEGVTYGIPQKKIGVSSVRTFFAWLIYKGNSVIHKRKEQFSSFRCMPQNIAKSLSNQPNSFVNIEQIICNLKLTQYNILVNHHPSIAKKSRYTTRKLFVFVMLSVITYTYLAEIFLSILATFNAFAGFFVFVETKNVFLIISSIFISLLPVCLFAKFILRRKLDLNNPNIKQGCYEV
jgi:polyisoprenyl-phosphate glycosyltransferase